MRSKRLKSFICLILISLFSIQSITYASTKLIKDSGFESLIKQHCKQAKLLKSQAPLKVAEHSCCDHQPGEVSHCNSCFANLISMLTIDSFVFIHQQSDFAQIGKSNQIYIQPTFELFKPPI